MIDMETRKFILFSTFFPPYHLGGDATHVENLARLLSNKGNEVHVVHIIDSYNFKNKINSFNINNINDYQDGIIRHPLISPYGNLSLFKAYSLGGSKFYSNRCENIVKQVKPDIIHFHNIAGFGPSIFGVKAKESKIYTAHDYWLVCHNSKLMKNNKHICTNPLCCEICLVKEKRPIQLWRWRSEFKINVRSIKRIVAPSCYLKNQLIDFGIDNDVRVIPNFVFDKSKSIVAHNNRDHLLFVGYLGEHKGIINLLNIYNHIYDKIKVPLHIIGKGPLEKKIQNMINTCELKSKVIFLGRLNDEELSKNFSHAIGLILPSVWPENNPMVAIEALSHGTPVIGTGYGGIPEIIGKIDKNLIFSSHESLVAAIENVINSTNVNERCKKIFQMYYSEEAYYEQYVKLF